MGYWYTTREAVKGALGSKLTARDDTQVDEAIETASRSVEQLCNRAHFYPWTGTRHFDHPQNGYGRTWEVELDEFPLITLTSITAGGTALTIADLILEPRNSGPPYTTIAADTDTGATFGAGSGGDQRRVAVTGLWGYSDDSKPAGALAEALDTSEPGVDVTDSSKIGVGTLLKCESERMNVTARDLLDTGQNTSAALDADDTDDAVGLTDGAQFHVGEELWINSEAMLLVAISGNTGTVKRAWNGTRLAAHLTAQDIYAPRRLTVERGAAGTTAAAHDTATALTRWAPPGGVWSLTVAEAIAQVENEQAGYARITGEGEGARETGGRQVESLRKQVRNRYGRSRGPVAV